MRAPASANRIDANQAKIIRDLRRMGAFVVNLSRVGNGCFDILVAFRGRWIPLEIKDGAKPPSEQQLTPAEIKFHQLCPIKIAVVHNSGEAIRAVL